MGKNRAILHLIAKHTRPQKEEISSTKNRNFFLKFDRSFRANF